MRFEELDLLFINVLEQDTEYEEINVIYRPIGLDTEEDDYYIRLLIQKDSVNMILENENEVDGDGFLTDEEELFVLQHYAMHTVYDVAQQY